MKREVFRYDRRRVVFEPEGTLKWFHDHKKDGLCNDETIDFVATIDVDARDFQGYETIRAMKSQYMSEKDHPTQESF